MDFARSIKNLKGGVNNEFVFRIISGCLSNDNK